MKPGRSDGFTLLEVLVASALTALIAGVLLVVVATTLGNWNRTQGRLRAASQAQRVLDQLERDLQGALWRDDGAAWFIATVQPSSSVSSEWIAGGKSIDASLDLMSESMSESRFGVAGVWLRFFTTRPGTDPRTGDSAAPVAVGYQIVRRAKTHSGSEIGYYLYRSEITAAATQAAGYDLTGDAFATVSTVEGAAGNLITPPARYLIAENVVDFGVTLYAPVTDIAGSSSVACVFPLSATDLEYRASPRRLPCIVDVMIRVLTDEGARRIAALETHRLDGDWWRIAEANSYTFTRRIAILARGS